jgi:hypothetical protein
VTCSQHEGSGNAYKAGRKRLFTVAAAINKRIIILKRIIQK